MEQEFPEDLYATNPENGPPKLTDSPWFWGYLFGMCALIALFLMLPKYGPMQARIERSGQGRMRAAQNLNNYDPDVEMSTADETEITLTPLFVGMGILSAAAWYAMIRNHRKSLATWKAKQLAKGISPGQGLS
ncbi:MAG: hypothetical protein ACO1RA_00850 [Planctomycetaceae bacterium]